MGQLDILEWLTIKRMGGDENFFGVEEIQRGLILKDLSRGGIYNDLSKLHRYGFVELKTFDPCRPWVEFTRKYRAKINTMEKKESGL